ncbi:MAG: HEAT repeat domain-containing protein [Actinobacteria bacterium]|nr:HEAT repeat domain-containing protein [Actinomycetota bacterium]
MIEALASLHAESAAPTVRRFVESDNRILRSTAIGYLYNHDTPDAAPFFLRQLRSETEPDLVQTLVDGLVMWDHVEAAPELGRLADNAQDADIRRMLAQGARELQDSDPGDPSPGDEPPPA